MDLVHRIWPREGDSLDLGGSFVERLKQLSEGSGQTPSGDAPAPGGPARESAPVAAPSSEASPAPEPKADASATATTPPSEETREEQSAELVAVAVASADAAVATQTAEAASAEPKTESVEIPSVAKDPTPAVAEATSAPRAEAAQAPSNSAETVPAAPRAEMQPSTGANGDGAPQSLAEPPGPGRKLLDQLNSAVEQVEEPRSNGQSGEPRDQFETVHRQFEADLRNRLDGALAEFEQRMSSQTLIEDLTGQLEQKIRKGANSIFGEVQSQAWMMHNAVAGELRAFRDQFNREIQERVALLDRSAQQALRLKESLEQELPKAEEAVRSLSLSGQEASVRLQAASDDFAERLSTSRQELSQEVENQKSILENLGRQLRDDRSRLKEDLEAFQREAGAACELLTRTADHALERFNAEAAQVREHNREELEKLAVEVEQRILSSGFVEKATEQLACATQEMVEPSLDRIRKASQEADSVAETLALNSRRVSGNLEKARQEIESRLGNLLGEQLGVLETTMTGFQQKASEDLGDMVERVVTQSTRQLDERLHGLLQDLFVSTNNQINGAARATLTTLHSGLKDVFDESATDQAAAEETSDNHDAPGETPEGQ